MPFCKGLSQTYLSMSLIIHSLKHGWAPHGIKGEKINLETKKVVVLKDEIIAKKVLK